MAKSRNQPENSKKAAGQARKAETAAMKKDAEAAKTSAAEDATWAKGSKSNAKQEEAAAKKAEAARKKAERDALLAAEEKEARAAPKGGKSAPKKSNKAAAPAPKRGLDLSQLDDDEGGAGPSRTEPALVATGIDNALDALSLATKGETSNAAIDRHPERRFKAAYAAFEEHRLPEIEAENPGLRRNQRVELCRKEFEKSDENPFNKASARWDASKEELRDIKKGERERVEGLLAQKD